MNEETREAAWKYARCQHHSDRQGEDRSIKDFEAGAGWATRNLRWIPVTESLPERYQNCLFIVDPTNGSDIGRVLGGNYIGNPESDTSWTRHKFNTPGQAFIASHWCPVPEQLLKSIL